MILPSSIAAVARPDTTIPICSTEQLFVPVAFPTCSDHFQPGSYVARPIVMPLRCISSNLPLGKVRTSSGFSKRFRITSYKLPPNPACHGWDVFHFPSMQKTGVRSSLRSSSTKTNICCSCLFATFYLGQASFIVSIRAMKLLRFSPIVVIVLTTAAVAGMRDEDREHLLVHFQM